QRPAGRVRRRRLLRRKPAMNNTRDNRFLILILCVAAGAGLIMLALTLFINPLLDVNAQIDHHTQSRDEKFAKVQRILRDKALLPQWRVLSLRGVENLPKVKGPANPQHDRDTALLQAQDRYVTALREGLKRHRLAFDDIPRPRLASTKGIPEIRPGVPVY